MSDPVNVSRIASNPVMNWDWSLRNFFPPWTVSGACGQLKGIARKCVWLIVERRYMEDRCYSKKVTYAIFVLKFTIVSQRTHLVKEIRSDTYVLRWFFSKAPQIFVHSISKLYIILLDKFSIHIELATSKV